MSTEYDDLLAKMNALPGETRTKALRKSLRAMGKVVEAAIIERAPEQSDTPHGSLAKGELKGNIGTRVHIAQDENSATEHDSVVIGPGRKTAYIAEFVETGHANRPRSKPSNKPRTDRVEAHPFVRPAFDATKEEAIAVFEQTMADEIRKAFDA